MCDYVVYIKICYDFKYCFGCVVGENRVFLVWISLGVFFVYIMCVFGTL